jgi:hypothetical protein
MSNASAGTHAVRPGEDQFQTRFKVWGLHTSIARDIYGLIANKEVSKWEINARIKSHGNIAQARKYISTLTRAKEDELKQKVLELKILTEDTT